VQSNTALSMVNAYRPGRAQATLRLHGIPGMASVLSPLWKLSYIRRNMAGISYGEGDMDCTVSSVNGEHGPAVPWTPEPAPQPWRLLQAAMAKSGCYCLPIPETLYLNPATALQVSGGVAAVDQQLSRTYAKLAAGFVGERRPAQRPRRHVPGQLLRRGRNGLWRVL